MVGRFFSGVYAALLFDIVFGFGGPMLASGLLGSVHDPCARGAAAFWITTVAVVLIALVAGWRFLRHHDDGWRVSGFLAGFVLPFGFILASLHGSSVACT